MPGKIADASVLAAIVFGEPRAQQARQWIDDSVLYEPVLLAYELTSVARKKALNYQDLVDSIGTAFRLSLSLDIRWTEVDHYAVWSLALEAGLTTYDATYLWLARDLGLPLLTFDSRLQRAARRS